LLPRVHTHITVSKRKERVMKVVARIAFVMFGCAVLIAGISLMSPRAAHAVTAAYVLVSNTSAQPIPIQDVNNPAHTPFGMQATVTIPDGQELGFGTFSIPSGTRLVVESVSAFRIPPLTPNQNLYLYVGVHDPTENTDMVLPVIPADGELPGTMQNMKLYVNPGKTLDFGAHRSGSVGAEAIEVSVSGYLVPAS
jgi:hypothetical protein